MKYKVSLTITGYIEIEADSEQEAREQFEDGYSLSSVIVETDELDEIEKLEPDC